jgi:4-amino-4-deoxy-L-arabinose transferase-like glycosyltransferase
MKRIFWHCVVALAAGFCLRLFFVLKYPANSGDTVLYEQMAVNWLQHHVYAMEVYGRITPVDLRMPGYPAFLALVYAITGRIGADARMWVTLAQALVDLSCCLLIAALAAVLHSMMGERYPWQRAFVPALWLSALCPFTANYAAVPLTEVFATLFTAAALLPLCLLVGRVRNNGWLFVKKNWRLVNDYRYLAAGGALVVGVGTMFRPEAPLLLLACWMVLGVMLIQQREPKRWLLTLIGTGLACALPLVPWTLRNAITLHEFQPLAPKNSNLPGELVPFGFMSWEKTWLFRFREVYLVPWKLNDEAINVSDIPNREFDTPEEKARVASILEPYNSDLTLTADEDAAFARLARERTARHPLRTYVWLPVLRGITMWFTPRIELIPVSGTVFPLLQSWRDDKVDQGVTVGLFLLNIVYIGLAMWGAALLWKRSAGVRPALLLLLAFLLLRTAFLTTLETPEPRYVLVCFPALISLAAQVFARPSEPVATRLPGT